MGGSIYVEVLSPSILVNYLYGSSYFMSPKHNKAMKVKVWKINIIPTGTQQLESAFTSCFCRWAQQNCQELDSSSAGIVLIWTQILQQAKKCQSWVDRKSEHVKFPLFPIRQSYPLAGPNQEKRVGDLYNMHLWSLLEYRYLVVKKMGV